MAETVYPGTFRHGLEEVIGCFMKDNRNSASLENVVCTLLFGAFTFLYLYFFQNDMLAYAQHVLSKGTTVYNPFIGAFAITGVLLLLSLLATSALSKRLVGFPALGHLPSVLVLAAITDIHIVSPGHENVFGYVWLAALLIFAVGFVFNSVASRMVFIPAKLPTAKGLFVNLFILFMMIFFAVRFANTAEEDHVTLGSERMVAEGEYGKAIDFIDNCNANSPELTMVRAFALAETSQLGETFFRPNIMHGSDNLLPLHQAQLKMLPALTIYKALGGVPSAGLTVRSYLEIMAKKGCLTSVGRDYLLTACLMDKDLDTFMRHYKDWGYPTTDATGNYGEALVLYAHMKGNECDSITVPQKEKDWNDFLATKKRLSDKTLQESALRKAYGNTYWFYYFFTSSTAFTQSVSSEK